MGEIISKYLEKPRLFYYSRLNDLFIKIGDTQTKAHQSVVARFGAIYNLNNQEYFSSYLNERYYLYEGIADKYIILRYNKNIIPGIKWEARKEINPDIEEINKMYRLFNQNLGEEMYAVFAVLKYIVEDSMGIEWYFDGYIMRSIHGIYTWEYDIENCILRRYNHPLNPDQSVKEIKLTDDLEGIKRIKYMYKLEDPWESFIKKQLYVFRKIFSN